MLIILSKIPKLLPWTTVAIHCNNILKSVPKLTLLTYIYYNILYEYGHAELYNIL